MSHNEDSLIEQRGEDEPTQSAPVFKLLAVVGVNTESGSNEPMPFPLQEERGTGESKYRPRRRDAQGRPLRHITTEARRKTSQRWYSANGLQRFSIPMPVDLVALLKAHSVAIKEPLWKMTTRMLQDALDREQVTPIEVAQGVEDLLR